MMRGRDPSSSPRMPANPRGMWRCPHCGAWNDPENDPCFSCDFTDARPLAVESEDA